MIEDKQQRNLSMHCIQKHSLFTTQWKSHTVVHYMRNERANIIIFDHISIQDCAICDTILIRLHADCPWFRLGFLIFLVRFQVAHGFAYGFVKINLHVFNMEACFCCGKEMKNVIATFYLKIQAFPLAILSLYPTFFLKILKSSQNLL